MSRGLGSLEAACGYTFRDPELLKQALIHPSRSGEMAMKRYESNQRLEFLGDAVLELVVSDYLYHIHPQTEEGRLTRMRASLVFEAALASCALEIGLDGFVLLGKGEEKSGGRKKNSILSDTFEALVGAVYLDGGLESAADFIRRNLLSRVGELTLLKDGKTVMQEYAQQTGAELLYRTEGNDAPDHMKEFRCVLYLNGVPAAEGRGHSKKSAEQDAAVRAAAALSIGMDDCSEPPPHGHSQNSDS